MFEFIKEFASLLLLLAGFFGGGFVAYLWDDDAPILTITSACVGLLMAIGLLAGIRAVF